MVERNITFIQKKEYDDVRNRYVQNINASIILDGDDAIDDVWNVYNIHKVPSIKRGIFLSRFITEDAGKQMTSRKVYRMMKYNFLSNKRKHNVSLTVFHEINTKTLEGFLVDNKPEFLN